MLSILDLLDAGTLDLDLAALLMAEISRGASFLVGARPGGAGKTTVMCALLNLVPKDCELIAATAAQIRAAPRANESGRRCYVCHEIGAGPYFAYLWGADLRAYCALSTRGHTLATNLHADDLDEARSQVCDENGVPPELFAALRLALFLRVRGGHASGRRWIERAYLSDGNRGHALVFDHPSGIHASAFESAQGIDPAWTGKCRAFLEQALRSGGRTIEAVRADVTAFLRRHSAPT